MSQTTCPKCGATRSQLVECHICGEFWDLDVGSNGSREAELLEVIRKRDVTIGFLRTRLPEVKVYADTIRAAAARTILNLQSPRGNHG